MLNLGIKTAPVTAEAAAAVLYMQVMLLFTYSNIEYTVYTVYTETCVYRPYLCIRSGRDRRGFYAEIQIIFGTVYSLLELESWILSKIMCLKKKHFTENDI